MGTPQFRMEMLPSVVFNSGIDVDLSFHLSKVVAKPWRINRKVHRSMQIFRKSKEDLFGRPSEVILVSPKNTIAR